MLWGSKKQLHFWAKSLSFCTQLGSLFEIGTSSTRGLCSNSFESCISWCFESERNWLYDCHFFAKSIKVIYYGVLTSGPVWRTSDSRVTLTTTLLHTLCCISLGRCCLGLETRVIIKISKKSLLTNKLWHVFMGMKQKFFFFFLKKKIQNGRLKKTEFFNFVKSWAISAKISWIGPWVSRIDWCKEHQCDSTYMAVRLSDVSPK